MKTSEYPEEDSRAEPFDAAGDEPQRSLAEKPRYLDLPVSAEDARAQRNLTWGVVCLVLALIAVWLGLKFDRAAALQCLAASLGAFGLFWLLHNSRILRQRHGIFLGIGLVALFGTVLPFLAVGLKQLDQMADQRMAGGQPAIPAVTTVTVPPPVPTVATAPKPPAAPDLSPELSPDEPLNSSEPGPSRGKSRRNAQAEPASENAGSRDHGVERDFLFPPPDMKEGRVVALTRDLEVTIDGRKGRLKEGQLYKLLSFEDGIVTFLAGDQQVEIEEDYVKFVGQSQETPEAIRAMAQKEATDRYPEIGVENSKANRLFLKAWMDLRDDPEGKVLLDNPRWPVILADQLAQLHGWRRADVEEDPVADKGVIPASPAESTEPDIGPDAPAQGPSRGTQSAPPAPATPGPAKPLKAAEAAEAKAPERMLISEKALDPIPEDGAAEEKVPEAPAAAKPAAPKIPAPGEVVDTGWATVAEKPRIVAPAAATSPAPATTPAASTPPATAPAPVPATPAAAAPAAPPAPAAPAPAPAANPADNAAAEKAFIEKAAAEKVAADKAAADKAIAEKAAAAEKAPAEKVEPAPAANKAPAPPPLPATPAAQPKKKAPAGPREPASSSIQPVESAPVPKRAP